MEDTPSWKGHSFTLLVFGGIVVLCSIFFVLGMLVGRSQGQRIAEMNAAEEATKKPAGQPPPETTLDYPTQISAIKPDDPFVPEPTPPTVPTTAEKEPVTTAQAKPDPAPAPIVPKPAKDKSYLQIVALEKLKDAEDMRDKLQSKGFKVTIMLSEPGSKNRLNRVWVGPYDSAAEAKRAKTDLEEKGFQGAYLVK